LLKAVGHGTKGKHFCLCHRIIDSSAVTKGARKLRNLGDPAAIKLFSHSLCAAGSLHRAWIRRKKAPGAAFYSAIGVRHKTC